MRFYFKIYFSKLDARTYSFIGIPYENISNDLALAFTGPTVAAVTSPDDLYIFCTKEPGQNKWKCSICSEYTNNGRNHVRNHVESKHFPNSFQYQCPQCDKTCNTKKGLDVHKSERHRNILSP